MERDRFDALARLFGTAGSRRRAFGVLIGAVLLSGRAEAAAKKKHRKKRKRTSTAGTCFGTRSCGALRSGQSFEGCNLAGTVSRRCDGCDFRGADLGGADFHAGSFQGASFRDANLRQADLRGADLTGVSFRDACLAGANLAGAKTDGAHFAGAIFCGTVGGDGQILNGGCGQKAACCPPCLSLGAVCGAGVVGSCCGAACVDGVCRACARDADCGGERPFCCDGACAAQCCRGSQCPQGLCDDGRCVECITNGMCLLDETCCEGSCCAADCTCAQRVPGPSDACIDFTGGCDFPCDGDADCQADNPGWICVEDFGCPEIGPHCHPPCGTVDVQDRQAITRSGHRP